MNYKLIFAFVFILLSLTFVSSCDQYGTFKQGTSINLINTCSSCTSINASIVYPDGTQTGSFAFQNINNVYNYTFTNTTQLGTYNVIGLDAWCYSFEVTNTGESNTFQSGMFYIVALIFIILLILGLVYIIGKLPDSNAIDEQGNIMQINWLKYFRPVCWIIVWALGLSILFIISNITLAYIPNAMVGNLFFAFYKIAFWLTICMLPVYSIWILVRAFQDREMKKLIERGVDIKSTP